MSVSCSCEYDPEPGDIVWWKPTSHTTLRTAKRQRCRACKELIDLGSICWEFTRSKIPNYDVEIAIYGEDGEIPMASHFLCEECGDMFMSLHELNLCVDYDCDQRKNIAEFKTMKAEQVKADEYWRSKGLL